MARLRIGITNWPAGSTSTFVELIPDPLTHPELGPLPVPWWESQKPIPGSHTFNIEEEWFPVKMFRFRVFRNSDIVYEFQGFDPTNPETYRNITFDPCSVTYDILNEIWQPHADWTPIIIGAISVAGLIAIIIMKRK